MTLFSYGQLMGCSLGQLAKQHLHDVRSWERIFQVHRSYAVNPDRVSDVRRRERGRDWELKLEPPVNRVIPVGRGHLAALWAAYGEV